MSQFQGDSIFWIEVDKIIPNPYQPRREFDEERLQDLAESIRMYGVLQPLTVTRREIVRNDGGISVEYELIAGERRHRASKIAGLQQVPVIIRSGPEDAKVKLELAIIENLQREDLNAIDRAKAFKQLADEFGLNNTEIAKKMGKSREYVSNSLRLLALPENMQQAILNGQMSEGHARPLLMLKDRPEEQATLFKELIIKKMAVREAERIARSIAKDKARKKPTGDPKLREYEEKFAQTFGTRVHIEERQVGGQLVIDFFTQQDLDGMLDLINASLLRTNKSMSDLMNKFASEHPERLAVVKPNIIVSPTVMSESVSAVVDNVVNSHEIDVYSHDLTSNTVENNSYYERDNSSNNVVNQPHLYINSTVDQPKEQQQDDDGDMYAISRFSV